MKANTTRLFEGIEKVISSLPVVDIPVERKKLLEPLKEFVQAKVHSEQEILLTFICTHNSRRSHLAQVWAQTLAAYFGIPKLFSYSAGTEATALYPKIAETLRNTGFETNLLSEGQNPVYAIKAGSTEHPIIGFSKTLDHDFNPSSGFAAIMTCTQADEGCPLVFGAEIRFSIPFEDPKAYDATAQQSEKYQERSRQIARELYYVFSKITLENGKE